MAHHAAEPHVRSLRQGQSPAQHVLSDAAPRAASREVLIILVQPGKCGRLTSLAMWLSLCGFCFLMVECSSDSAWWIEQVLVVDVGLAYLFAEVSRVSP